MRASLPCMSKICLLLMRLPWLAYTVCRPFLTIFWFPFPLWLALLKDWALLDGGLCFSSAHHFSYYHLLSYNSIIPTAKLFASILLGLFRPAVYSSINGPVQPLVLLLHHWRASSALFLTLHSHGLLLNYLGFPGPITLSLILGVHGLAINPLLSLLSLLSAYRDPFSLFHIIYCPWFAFSLFPGSFKPIYLLKAHLFISRDCDLLFLPLGLNRFLSICQLFSVRVARLLLSTWASKWPSTI